MTITIRPVFNALFYRRPDFVYTPPIEGSIMEADTGSTITHIPAKGVPERLSFDKIISHQTCPPCTTLDFYNYLNNKVHCAENLQFFLWLRDYTHRFNRPGTTHNTATLSIWTHNQQEEALHKYQRQLASGKKMPISEDVKEVFKGTTFDDNPRTRARGDSGVIPPTTGSNNSEHTLVGTIAPWESREKTSSDIGSTSSPSIKFSSQEERDSGAARAGYLKAGLHYPFFHPSFRKEIETIIATYIIEGSSRQLNLSAAERYAVLCALSKTAHPSALFFLNNVVETTLRRQHHPNFILDAICNGNRPRVIFARALGAALIVVGTVAAILLSLSDKPRRYRPVAAIFWVLGVSTSIAAWKGMCVVLHGLHHRHVRPWELFQSPEELADDPLAPQGTAANDITTEYWVEKYRRRNIVRKIFDREVWIQEPALRQIQDAIFVQALGVSVLVGVVLAAVFVWAVPKGNMM